MVTTFDFDDSICTDLFNVDLLHISSLTCYVSYEAVAWFQHTLLGCASYMSFYIIAADYNEPLEAFVAVIDDDRYDMVE